MGNGDSLTAKWAARLRAGLPEKQRAQIEGEERLSREAIAKSVALKLGQKLPFYSFAARGRIRELLGQFQSENFIAMADDVFQQCPRSTVDQVADAVVDEMINEMAGTRKS